MKDITLPTECEMKQYCFNFIQDEICNLFTLLDIPVDEQKILMKMIENKKDICWNNFKKTIIPLVYGNITELSCSTAK